MRRLICSVLCVLGLAGGARAAVLLDQPLLLPGDGRASYIGGSTNFVTYDSITLAQTAEINQISWIGGFFDTGNSANNPPPFNATAWQFLVAEDAGGAPGALLDSASIAFADASASYLQQATLAGQPIDLYLFTATLVDPLLIVGGATQWFSVLAQGPSTNPLFAWMSGSGGDSVSIQFGPGNPLNLTRDRALRLEGSEVPEPPVLMLLTAALLLGAWRFRAGRAT